MSPGWSFYDYFKDFKVIILSAPYHLLLVFLALLHPIVGFIVAVEVWPCNMEVKLQTNTQGSTGNYTYTYWTGGKTIVGA